MRITINHFVIFPLGCWGLFLINTSRCLAQLNPLHVSVTLDGEVRITANPPLPYLQIKTLSTSHPADTSITYTNYGFRSAIDSFLESNSKPDLRDENVIVFTSQRCTTTEPIHQFSRYSFLSGEGLTFKLQLIEDEIRGNELYTSSKNELTLLYSTNKRLKKIKHERIDYPALNSKPHITCWDFMYNDTLLQTISNESSTIDYNYDQSGHLTNSMCYTGNLKNIDKSYLCMDSLENYYDKNIPTHLIWKYYRSESTDIQEMAYFHYSGNNLLKMVSYHSNGGLRKTVISYDTLNRVTVFKEHNKMGGLEIRFTYNQSGKLLQRNERWLSDCFERGCPETELMETYFYNSKGKVSEVVAYSTQHYFNQIEHDVHFTKKEEASDFLLSIES